MNLRTRLAGALGAWAAAAGLWSAACIDVGHSAEIGCLVDTTEPGCGEVAPTDAATDAKVALRDGAPEGEREPDADASDALRDADASAALRDADADTSLDRSGDAKDDVDDGDL